jgi:trans-aconitate methyltransferase
LEIGVGPGLAVELASREVPEGFVADIDHSSAMIQQAKKRNAAAIARGS